MRKFFSSSSFWEPSGIAIIRIFIGLMLVYHGWEVFDSKQIKIYSTWDSIKGLSSPLFMAYLGKASELITGILLTLGLFTRVASVIIIGTFLYITFFIGHGKFWYEDQHPFMFVMVGFIFFFTGPGNYSLDKVLFKTTGV